MGKMEIAGGKNVGVIWTEKEKIKTLKRASYFVPSQRRKEKFKG